MPVYTRTTHHSGHLTFFGVRVAAKTTFCSASVNRRDPGRFSAASTIQGSSIMRAVSR